MEEVGNGNYEANLGGHIYKKRIRSHADNFSVDNYFCRGGPFCLAVSGSPD
ncbi:MAG: hypothetical protein U9P10_05015 [Thermodesulfobacteriota bacterium]|nr:hypothetical protein [Thermodesulfobacteriota bacterium]